MSPSTIPPLLTHTHCTCYAMHLSQNVLPFPPYTHIHTHTLTNSSLAISNRHLPSHESVRMAHCSSTSWSSCDSWIFLITAAISFDTCQTIIQDPSYTLCKLIAGLGVPVNCCHNILDTAVHPAGDLVTVDLSNKRGSVWREFYCHRQGGSASIHLIQDLDLMTALAAE